MAWSVIPTKLPQDRITSAEMNLYIGDNLSETALGRTAATNGGFAMTSGVNEITNRAPLLATKTVSDTTSSTTPVSVGPTLGPFEHSGQFLIMMTATIRSTATTGITTFSVGGASGFGGLPGEHRGVRTNHTDSTTLSAHIMHYNLESPMTLDAYLWTDNGATTATVVDARYTVIPF